MKQCPQCRMTYTDDNQFCLEDGTTLMLADSMPSRSYSGDMPTIVSPQYQTPSQFQNPPPFAVPQTVAQTPTKQAAKWVFPVLGLLLGAIVVLGFLVFYERGEKSEKVNVNTNVNTNKETPKPSETAQTLATVQPTQTQNYSSGNGKYPEGSTRLLTENDLAGKSDWDLRIMRNEIYARHGYIFKSPEFRNYFMQQNWYRPQYSDVSGRVSALEERNANFLKKYE